MGFKSIRAVFAAVLICAAFVRGAEAFELFGIKFFEPENTEADDDVIGDPLNYAVEFTVAEGEHTLESAIQGASTLWKEREKPASGAAGLLARARGDYKRILGTLYADGRYGGTISILVDGREAAGLPPDTELADPATISISVDPGPLFRFRKADVFDPPPPPLSRNDHVDLPSDKGFAPGEPALSGVILQAERLSVEAWRQQGYAKAAVIERRVEAAHDTDDLDATLVIEPGRKAAYGEVSVEGTERMDPAFVAYMTGLLTGEEFDPDDIERANKRLARLDVFRSQRIVEGDAIDENGLLPIGIVVQERLPRRFGVGGSYSTLDGAGIEAYWMHRNLFGRAERLRIEGKVAGIDSVDPADFTYRIGATFTKPGVFTPDTDFIASVFGNREVLDAYTRTAIDADAGFNHRFSEELSARLFFNGSIARFDDEFGRRDFQTIGLLAAITRDTRDNATNATEGTFLEVAAEPFYELKYGNAVGKLTAEGRAYYGFGDENRFVLAGRIKVGSLAGAPVSELPPDKLYFAGGGGSVRGYEYRGIGIPTATGGIVGGRSLIEGSAEVRTRVTDSIGLVGFVDAGYVGADSIPDFSDDLKVGAGIGLRYLTGLGPIRLDVAVPLNPGPRDPDFAFYVGIGQAF